MIVPFGNGLAYLGRTNRVEWGADNVDFGGQRRGVDVEPRAGIDANAMVFHDDVAILPLGKPLRKNI